MAVYDIDIAEPFKDGDFNIDIVDNQNIQAIVLTQKGQFYQWPTLGVGIIDQLNSPEEIQYLRSVIATELQKDNYLLTIYEATFESGKLEISLDASKTDQ